MFCYCLKTKVELAIASNREIANKFWYECLTKVFDTLNIKPVIDFMRANRFT